jgi:hypothetical protein
MKFAWLGAWAFCLTLAFYSSPPGHDIVAESMVELEVVQGGDPYATMAELQEKHGGPVDWPWTSPRPPAALLVGLPLVLFDPDTAVQLMTALNVTAFVIVVALSVRMQGVSEKGAVLLTPLLLASEPGRHLIMTANMFPLIALAVVATWFLAKRDVWWVGVPLGVAAGVRLFPAILIVALWVGGRRRVSIGAVATAVLLTLSALALPGVTVEGTIAVLGDAQLFMFHPANASLLAIPVSSHILPASTGTLVGLLLALGIVAVLVRLRPRWSQGLLYAAPAMLLTAPVTWPTYLLTAAPSVANSSRRRWVMTALMISWYLPQFIGYIVPLTVSLLLVSLTQTSVPAKRDVLDPAGAQPDPVAA